jgi:hypothetical protein
MEPAHTWLTSHTVLITTRIWQMTGLAHDQYSLVSSRPNQADRRAEYSRGPVYDAEGNSYFVSDKGRRSSFCGY